MLGFSFGVMFWQIAFVGVPLILIISFLYRGPSNILTKIYSKDFSI
ncbi:hypothetical protein PVOR_25253 [Paenibacillus vortex V453]|uniref:Uncharacterized protein n=1 Tax=Paenibacillus vortex V453 TaxID=715225 RepID=A0A2R9SPP1_9BACL|nr:hypothetical protein PVOR_25253 [Paenibacillus vortex V453]